MHVAINSYPVLKEFDVKQSRCILRERRFDFHKGTVVDSTQHEFYCFGAPIAYGVSFSAL